MCAWCIDPMLYSFILFSNHSFWKEEFDNITILMLFCAMRCSHKNFMIEWNLFPLMVKAVWHVLDIVCGLMAVVISISTYIRIKILPYHLSPAGVRCSALYITGSCIQELGSYFFLCKHSVVCDVLMLSIKVLFGHLTSIGNPIVEIRWS